MKILNVEQRSEVWNELRRGRITGTKNKGIRPLSRGTDRTPQGFWDLLAERVSVEADGEPVMERGLRLEAESIAYTVDKYKLKLAPLSAVWQSDDTDYVIVSPDGYEDSKKPTWAIETKSFNSANHLKYIIQDMRAKKLPGYNSYDSIPKEYKDQLLSYFLVNDDLQRVYYSFYDDRIALDHLMHYVIEVERSQVEGEVELLKDIQKNVLDQIEETIKEIK